MNETFFRALIRKMVRESVLREDAVDEDVNTIAVGDVVDVMGGETDHMGVRVIELVDDVRGAVGMPEDEDDMHLGGEFSGPGFVGQTEEGELVFSLNQVIPGSKAKYYFPDMGEDEYGRDVENPYRKMAARQSRASVSRPGDFLPGDED